MGGWFFWDNVIVVVLIAAYEWRRLRRQPGKDRTIFIALLLIGAVLSYFDLPNLSGPASLTDHLFRPFRPLAQP